MQYWTCWLRFDTAVCIKCSVFCAQLVLTSNPVLETYAKTGMLLLTLLHAAELLACT